MSEEIPFRNISAGHSTKSQNSWQLPEFNPKNALIVILAVVVLALALYIYKPQLFKAVNIRKGTDAVSGGQKAEPKKDIKSSGYSAVFLTSNQVYFGKFSDADSNYPKLREVYYLRVERPLQPPPATESAQPDISLVKLGNELHGPVDEIKFNRGQILFVEDLKTDSKIVKAIEEFKSKK